MGGVEDAGVVCRCWVEGEEKEFPPGLIRPLVIAVLLSVMKEFSKNVGKQRTKSQRKRGDGTHLTDVDMNDSQHK